MAILIPGPASKTLVDRLAALGDYPKAKVSYRVFPDGESYIRVEDDLKGEVAIVVQSCPPPQDKRIMELLQLIDASLRAGSSRVIAVVPYLAYSRQDKVFLNYEALSSKIVARMIESVGTQALITVNVHSEMVLSYFNIKALSVNAFPEIASYLASLNLKNPLILSPDKKRYPDAKLVADMVKGEASFLEKKRDLITGEIKTEEKHLEVEGRDVVIIDDIISTGGTIINAANIVSKRNPRSIRVACIHGVYASNALEKLRALNLTEIVSTDTIESETSKITVAKAILEALKEVLES